ncbi:MAG: lipoyl synthase [Armatimonadetes bacterium]|nr:lipoyl synthase [Armatimonadota bacterium]
MSHPAWLRLKAPGGENFSELKGLVRHHNLHTVCESARCPNIGECWEKRTATFMLLGNTCTRSCGFCAVLTGRPSAVDLQEPYNVAEAVCKLSLKYAVVTSVNRDDLKDGGAFIFARTIRQIRLLSPDCQIEVLIPDFEGNQDALQKVINERPDVLNHNMETVSRLYRRVRPQAKYPRSLELLRRSKDAGLTTKSGLMVGVGETRDELIETFGDMIAHGCDILTIGQYLRPSLNHLPVDRYYAPEEFVELKQAGESMGFKHVESGPLVRSSYHAREQKAVASGA